jgi:hypothetical protein
MMVVVNDDRLMTRPTYIEKDNVTISAAFVGPRVVCGLAPTESACQY